MKITSLNLALENIVRTYGEDAGALSQAACHHFSTPGKRTRSKLLFSTSPSPTHIELLLHAAAAVELVHEASIVHDDIQDLTEFRRGKPSVWHKFGANTALLLGDHFVSAAFRTIAEVEVRPNVQAKLFIMLSQAISRAASGQHLQLSSNAKSEELAKIYNEVAISKTGAFIALPLQFSNLIGHKQTLDTEPARLCGEQLGLAYQILDDLRPFFKTTTLARNEDILAKVITAPVAAMQSITPNEDPFEALIELPYQRNLALNLCKSWQAQAIKNALEHANKLPTQSSDVINKFIEERLIIKAPSNPLKNTSANKQKPRESYQPWQKHGNASTEIG